MPHPPSPYVEDLLRRTYAAFNARDIDAVLVTLHPEVDWPNLLEGVRLSGHEAVRAYWSRQFVATDPQVDPVRMTLDDEGRIIVDVHQVIRSTNGTLLAEGMVQHVYTMRDGLVARMDVVAG